MKKIYCFLIYVMSILGIIISDISSICASEIIGLKQANDFNADLIFIQKILLENHPGICNFLDPGFLEELNENFKIAEQKLFCAGSDEEKAKILQELGRSFHDAHLWICYDLNKVETPIATREARSFGIQKVKEGTYWISIPTFRPSKDRVKNLNQIIELLPQLCKQTIVFDLRGNGGGNSLWGTKLLKALFGEEYVKQRLAESRRNVYTEWRVSKGNLEWIKELIPLVKEQFGESFLESVYEGMKNAFSRSENYYREDLSQFVASSNVVNSFSGRVIAIIDKGCGSACLNFIDGLKAMNVDAIFIGETTAADSLYMELRRVPLPSGKGVLGFPIKVFRNRPRGDNVPHIPDIQYNSLQNTAELQNFVLKHLENLSSNED